MKLWILRPVENLPKDDDPWNPWYDKAFGFVVRAETAQQAREAAMAEAGDETCGKFMQQKTADTKTPWLDSKYSTCVELTADGETGVVMRDFAAA